MFFFFFAGMDMHKSFTPTLEVSGFAIRLAFQNLPSMVEPTGSLDSSGITSLCGSWGYKTITKWSVFSSRATKLLRSFPFVRTGRPNHFRRNEKFTYYYFSIRDLSNFKWYAQNVLKCSTKCFERAFIIVKITCSAMVRPASFDLWKAPFDSTMFIYLWIHAFFRARQIVHLAHLLSVFR